MNEDVELEVCRESEPLKATWLTRKYMNAGLVVDVEYIDVNKSVCEDQMPIKERINITTYRQKIRDRSKYMPHQGKQEMERRRAKCASQL